MSIYPSSLAGRRAGLLRLIVAVVATLVLILGLIPAVAQAQNSDGDVPDVTDSEDDSTTDEVIIDDTVTDPDATATDATPGTDPEGLAEDINDMIMPLQQTTGPVEIDGIRINSAVIPVRQWSQVEVVWDWSAPNGVKNGDTFTVTFPDELNVNHDETFNLLDENDVVGGECVAVRGTGADAEAGTEKVPGYVTCTFNSNFENVDDVRGTITVGSNAWETTSASEVTFVGDGDRDISVDLPGEEGILPEIIRTDIEVDKHGWYDGDSKTGTWELMIPGTALEGLDGDLEITDTLSGYSHVFLDRNPLGTVWTYNGTNGSIVLDETVAWFTPTISIAEGGQELTMTVAMPADGWNPDHLYRIRYFTETADGEVAPYYEETTNKAVVNGKEVDRTISRKPYGSGTISGVDRGSFEVTKRLDATGDVRARIPAGTMFTVWATYEKDGAAQTETIQVPLDGSAAGNESLPAGTVVTLTEINLPEIPGVTFGEPRFSATNDNDENVEISADGRTATVTIIESDNVDVTLTNTADVATGEFLVTKTVADDAGENTPEEFTINYVCDADSVDGTIVAGEENSVTVADGETVKVGDFPDGTTCRVTGEDDAEVDGYTLTINSGEAVTVVAGEQSIIEVINSYSQLGSFAVTKELGGLTGSSARDDEFELQATWTVDGVEETREFTVRAGETYTDFPDLPVGTEVTLSETAPSNTLVARWNTPAFSSNTPGAVVDNGDGTATLTIQPDSVDEATLVTVTNSANPPWWWILVPLIPIIGSSAGSSEGSSAAGSSGSSEGSSGSSTDTPDAPGTPDQPDQPDTPGQPETPSSRARREPRHPGRT
ncbi:DUF5979 domain-containing protein [Corynebacterium suedekumii]|nr:DUF5979 domain-containing protein [Corynebacterium suedekumii]